MRGDMSGGGLALVVESLKVMGEMGVTRGALAVAIEPHIGDTLLFEEVSGRS